MALSREEASNIGKEAAEKVVKSAQACRCGLAVWDTRTNIASIEAVILHQQADWLQPISRLQQDTLTIVERDCGVDMTKAKELSARLENDIKKRDWQEARYDLVLLRGAIQGRFVERVAEESQSPPALHHSPNPAPVCSKCGSIIFRTSEKYYETPEGIFCYHCVPRIYRDSAHERIHKPLLEQVPKHITIADPGKTTFKPGEVISKDAFDKENERVRKLGEKPATGTPDDK